ncbi:MAG: redox-regulated ATPase YchF [Candidatus Eremiobacteraeota bacterium]|nr:redox-regulated ATPase YchF [Candidatus Eremiobacteraeota bacterium]
MALSCGIVGLPNVGKSTIFNALTRSANALAANYPFATIEPNVGEVPVPDDRLAVLARISASRQIVPATTRFVDIAGLVRGASRGEGLGNAFLSHIREVDAIVMVVRCFEDPSVVHVEGAPDPIRDIEIVDVEMALADLASLTRRVERLEREARRDPKQRELFEATERLVAALEAGRPARTFAADSPEAEAARESFLLTAKPVLFVANVDEEQIGRPGPAALAVVERAAREHGQAIVLSGKIEAELAGLSLEDAKHFREELGLQRSGLEQMILSAFELLGLMTFLTTGPKETRAWTIARETRAAEAAGKIHSDIERGFIRAEVVGYEDLARLGSEEAVRAAGLLRSEGRDYIVQEGDVVHFLFKV